MTNMSLKEYQRMTGQNHKYRNHIVYDDEGIRYDSKKEYARWKELQLLQRAGEISGLERQKRFILQPSFEFEGKTIRAITYIADFYYKDETEHRDHCQDMYSRWVVEDVKSPVTRKNQVYVIKKKMMMRVHGIKIKEM